MTVHRIQADQIQFHSVAGVKQEDCIGRLRGSVDSQICMDSSLIDQDGTGDYPIFRNAVGDGNGSQNDLRKEIASDAALDNVRALLTEPPKILTRSRTRSRSLGNISEVVHK